MFTARSALEFQAWFAGSRVRGVDGQPLMVHHGTTAIKVVPGQVCRGDAEAAAELQALAERYGIAEGSSVPSVLERWLDMGMAVERGVTLEVATRARELLEKARPNVMRPMEAIGFDAFEMPVGDKELGAHFGNRTQASGFGTVFDFYLKIVNPLRMPDLGTWHYQSVMREARRCGVAITEDEYTEVFNARDNNAALRCLLMSKGIDGIVYRNEAEGKGDSFIAFSTEQIVLASTMDPAWTRISQEQLAALRAQALLDTLGLEVLSQEEIEGYNASRFDGGSMNPEVSLEALQWESMAGYLQKTLYVRDPDGESLGVRRTAFYYPEGVSEGDGTSVLIVEDEGGREIAFAHGEAVADRVMSDGAIEERDSSPSP